MREFVIVIHSAEEGGFWGEFPSVPGCFVQGETVDDLLADAPDALSSHLAALAERGETVDEQPLIVKTVELAPAS